MSGGKTMLVDAREFVAGRFTGIGRVLSGLALALAESQKVGAMTLAASTPKAVPESLARHPKTTVLRVPQGYLRGEWTLSRLSADFDVYLSPYPKLPLFGVRGRAVNIIHDVHNITHGAYAGTPRAWFDRLRVGMGLNRADMTWYVSEFSRSETEKLMGTDGRDARVRHSGIGSFSSDPHPDDSRILERLGLQPGYVLAVGNGLPHKNLGVLLKCARSLTRPLVLAGCGHRARVRWEKKHPEARALWPGFVGESEMGALLRGAFCLAQPSLAEGFGYPPLEAMACGTPAIVSDIPVLCEVCGGAALAVDPHSPDAWAEAVASLDNKASNEAMVKAGLSRVSSMTGDRAWAGHVADMEELLGCEEGV